LALKGPLRWEIDRRLKEPGVQEQVDQTVHDLTGGALSMDDIHAFERRALDTATTADALKLRGVEPGAHIVLTPDEKRTTDGVMSRIGTDAQADRFRGAYQGAFRAGRFRVR
jgi:hypothetical protein